MKGCIIERNGSYLLKVSLGKNPQTDRYDTYYETCHAENKSEARRRLREILTKLDKGTFIKPGKETLSDFFKRWLDEYAQVNLAPRTVECYADIIRLHLTPEIGNIPLVQVKPEHLQKYYAKKMSTGLSARTVRYHHTVLHNVLKHAVKWGLLTTNPADSTDPPKPKRTEMKIMNESEVNKFLEAAKQTPYYSLFYTAIFTGLRRSELLALKWADIDLLSMQLSVTRALHQLKDRTIVVREPKTAKSRRLIALSPSTCTLLREHKTKQEAQRTALELLEITDSDYVFSQWNGKPLLPATISHAWMKLARRTGLKGIRLHDSRHTHASLMLKQGVHPKIVQERLGHSSIQVTLDIYSHVSPGLQQAAANGFDCIIPKETKLDKELDEIIEKGK